MFRKGIFTIMALISIKAAGQKTWLSDTLLMKEITISANAVTKTLSGFRISVADSQAIRSSALEPLSGLLSENTSIVIKSYGPGSSSTISFRGTGASQAQVIWNDLSLNSPMPGQADVSLIPAGFIDELKIYSGGASMLAGSGGLGGAICLGTKPVWNDRTSVLSRIGSGSFGRYTGFLRLRTGNSSFQSVTRAYYHSADNDYTYLNNYSGMEPVEEIRQNAAVTQKSLLQEFFVRGKNSVTTASLWATGSERELPPNMLNTFSDYSETQKDKSIRATVSHRQYLPGARLDAAIAWLSEDLNYKNSLAAIDSKNRSNTGVARISSELKPSDKTSLLLTLNNEFCKINSSNYSESKMRYLATLSATVRRIFGEKLGTVFVVREIVNDLRFLVPDISAGIDFKPSTGSAHLFQANLSKNSRVPAMNDLYWNPGGNPDLKNEYSISGELSYDFSSDLSDHVNVDAGIVLHGGTIRDMIQWLPGDNYYWSPSNIAMTGTAGTESDLEIGYRSGRFAATLSGIYSFTRSVYLGENDYSGNQVIYVPFNQFNAALRTTWNGISAAVTTAYTGRRFTTVGNDSFLPGYNLLDLTLSYELKTGAGSFELTFKAENIFNVSYQVIAYYPMPMRSYLFSLTYNL